MVAFRIKAHITPNQPLILPLPADVPSGEVEVIVLFPEAPNQPDTHSSLREFSAWLREQAPSSRSWEEIDRAIEEERASWA